MRQRAASEIKKALVRKKEQLSKVGKKRTLKTNIVDSTLNKTPVTLNYKTAPCCAYSNISERCHPEELKANAI